MSSLSGIGPQLLGSSVVNHRTRLLEEHEDASGHYKTGLGQFVRERIAKIVSQRPKFDELLQKAQAGVPESQFVVGCYYDTGSIALGVERNCDRALKWYRNAANNGHTDAMINLAILLNRGPASNEGEARRWFEKAAEKGCGTGEFQLGVLCLRKIASASNYQPGIWTSQKGLALAFEHFERGAKLGHDLSMNNVAVMLLEGNGAEKNPGLARSWLEKAAVAGNPAAASNLAVIIRRGYASYEFGNQSI